MNKIIISKESNELSFKSWQEVAFHLTSKKTPISSVNAIAMLERFGWKLVSVEKDATTKGKSNIIETLIKQMAFVDKDALNELTAKRKTLLTTAKTSDDVNKVMALNIQIEVLSNPSIDRETFINKITSMYDDYIRETNNLSSITYIKEKA
jgi:hypothetical protein